MENQKMEEELGLIFSVSRECTKDTFYFLAHLEGGILFLESFAESVPETNEEITQRVFVFKAVKVGSAVIQFASGKVPFEEFIYEDAISIEVIPECKS